MGTARQLCVSRKDSDCCAVLCFLIQNKLHWVLHLRLCWEVLWGPDNPPLPASLLTTDFHCLITHTFAQKYNKTFRKHKEVVIEHGNINTEVRNFLLLSEILRAKPMLGILRRISLFFEKELGSLLFYLALEKCLGSFIFLLLW